MQWLKERRPHTASAAAEEPRSGTKGSLSWEGFTQEFSRFIPSFLKEQLPRWRRLSGAVEGGGAGPAHKAPDAGGAGTGMASAGKRQRRRKRREAGQALEGREGKGGKQSDRPCDRTLQGRGMCECTGTEFWEWVGNRNSRLAYGTALHLPF